MRDPKVEEAEPSRLSLSVVVPVYNEEDNVEILYDEIQRSVERLNRRCEIVFVDDGSADGTWSRLRGLRNREGGPGGPEVTSHVIRLARNFGQTAATQAGFDHAQGDIIVSMDGDLQNDPQDIPMLLEKLEEGFDVVCGWRRDRKDKALTRILPSKIANWLIGIITGVRIHDNGCSLRAYRCSVIKSIRLYSDMHRFIGPMCTMVGARVCEVVVHHRPRKHGKTKYGISRIWKVLLDLLTVKMLIHFHYRPMRFFALPLMLSLFGALGLGTVSIVTSVSGQQSIVLTGASLLLFFLFGSILSWGLVGEFLVKIGVQIDSMEAVSEEGGQGR